MPIAIVVASQAGWYSRLFPNPTGVNALEEYARAADAVAVPGFGVYVSWESEDGQTSDVPSVRVTRQPRARRFTVFLDFCRSEVETFGGALDLVRAGNAKSLATKVDLRPLSHDLSNLVNLEIRAAHLRFSEGRSNVANGTLIDGLAFLDNVERSDPRGGGVSTLGRSAILSMFAQSLDRLSLADCLELDRAVRKLLSRPPAAREVYAGLADGWQADVGTFAASMRLPATEPYPEHRALVARLRAMTPEAFAHAVEEARAFAVRTVASASSRLDGPEGGWTTPELGETKPPESDEAVPAALARAALKTNFYGLQFDPVYRTRLRLLDLSALGRAFWFRNGRYPVTLMELGPKVGDDPLSGKSFDYVPKPSGFVVSSAGTAKTGRIALDPRSPDNVRPGS